MILQTKKLQLDAANMKAGRSNQEASRLPNGLANRWGVYRGAGFRRQAYRARRVTSQFEYRRGSANGAFAFAAAILSGAPLPLRPNRLGNAPPNSNKHNLAQKAAEPGGSSLTTLIQERQAPE